MSTTTDNSNIDTNKQAGKDNQDHARLKKSLSHKHSQECPNYAPQGHGPPSKDIGTMYYDCKFSLIFSINNSKKLLSNKILFATCNIFQFIVQLASFTQFDLKGIFLLFSYSKETSFIGEKNGGLR